MGSARYRRASGVDSGKRCALTLVQDRKTKGLHEIVEVTVSQLNVMARQTKGRMNVLNGDLIHYPAVSIHRGS